MFTSFVRVACEITRQRRCNFRTEPSCHFFALDYPTDNFLRAWLAALAGPVAAVNFRPVDQLVADADQRLRDVEGRAFEKLVGVLCEERSRKGIGDFP